MNSNTFNLALSKEKMFPQWIAVEILQEIFLWALPYKQSIFYNFSFRNFLIAKFSVVERIK
jgi:hypothetical protein